MAMLEQERQDAAQALFEAERTRQWIEPITTTYPGADIADAYAIGQMVTEAKVAAGRRVCGHKVGYTSAAMRDAFGATEPDYGTIFDNWIVEDGSTISMKSVNRPWVEIELAFVLKAELGGPTVDATDVIKATDYVLPSIEICDSRFTTDGDGGVIDSIADAASCGLVIVGGNRVKLADFDPCDLTGALYINGELAESGTGAAVMGNPINAVAWLARKLSEFGVTMEAGHIVLSGSFIAARAVEANDSVVADFGSLGKINLEFSA